MDPTTKSCSETESSLLEWVVLIPLFVIWNKKILAQKKHSLELRPSLNYSIDNISVKTES